MKSRQVFIYLFIYYFQEQATIVKQLKNIQNNAPFLKKAYGVGKVSGKEVLSKTIKYHYQFYANNDPVRNDNYLHKKLYAVFANLRYFKEFR